MQAEHDVIIVGGGPAGLSTALFLGHLRPALRERLVVLEKAHYPREKICGGALGARAERALDQIGVRVDVPGAEVSRMSVALAGGSFLSQPCRVGRIVRRVEFDQRLAQIAKQRGIRVVEGVKVDEVKPDAGGVTLASSAGELRARVVIGADGVGSVVRKRLTDAPGTWRAQALEVDTEPTPHDLTRDIVHFDRTDLGFNGYAWDFPTLVDGQPLMCRGVYHVRVPGEPGPQIDLNERLAQRLVRMGLDLTKYKKKRYAERGFAPHEPLSAPRLLLVGEAAGIDPISGEGIAQALLYGQAAAPYLVSKLDADRLDFTDWKRTLLGTRLGVDLRVRNFLCRVFAGPARPFYERWCVENPDSMQLAARYFGGDRIDKRVFARLMASAAKYVALRGFGQQPFRWAAIRGARGA